MCKSKQNTYLLVLYNFFYNDIQFSRGLNKNIRVKYTCTVGIYISACLKVKQITVQ